MAKESAAVESVGSVEIFLSTDGKHTIHVSAPLGSGTTEELERIRSLAEAVFDPVLAKYGPKPAAYGTRGGGNSRPGGAPQGRPQGRPQAPTEDVDVFCEDCGSEIKGFTDKQGKRISAQTIAAARKRDFGKVTCGKGFCKAQDGGF